MKNIKIRKETAAFLSAAGLIMMLAGACSAAVSSAHTTAAQEGQVMKTAEAGQAVKTAEAGQTAGGGTGTAAAGEKTKDTEPPEVTVTASGSVYLVPDKAEISFGIQTSDASPEKALKKNAEEVNRVIEALRKQGIEDKSIRTDNVNLYQQSEYSEGKSRITGYEATVTMTVGDLGMEEVGSVITSCVEAGVNQMNGVRYFCSGYDEAYKEALQKAVAAAEEKAEVMASAAGMQVGEIRYLAEGYQDTGARYSRAANSFAKAEAAAMDVAEMMPGETEVKAHVTAVYEMKKP